MASKPKILVVDDAGPVVILCVNVLQALGYAIRAASQGEAAIELVRKEPFDLLVVDYKMPGMNGFEVLEQARRIRPDMVCMLMTAHGTPDIINEAARLQLHLVKTVHAVGAPRGGGQGPRQEVLGEGMRSGALAARTPGATRG